MRTVFQIPYVHLFEWWLLILFHRVNFAGLPWQNFDDTHEIGEDIRSEIEESFDLLEQYARPTPAGRAVIDRMRELVKEAERQWRKSRRYALGEVRARPMRNNRPDELRAIRG